MTPANRADIPLAPAAPAAVGNPGNGRCGDVPRRRWRAPPRGPVRASLQLLRCRAQMGPRLAPRNLGRAFAGHRSCSCFNGAARGGMRRPVRRRPCTDGGGAVRRAATPCAPPHSRHPRPWEILCLVPVPCAFFPELVECLTRSDGMLPRRSVLDPVRLSAPGPGGRLTAMRRGPYGNLLLGPLSPSRTTLCACVLPCGASPAPPPERRVSMPAAAPSTCLAAACQPKGEAPGGAVAPPRTPAS